MCTQNFSGGLPRHIGIRLVHHTSGRQRTRRPNDRRAKEELSPDPPSIPIEYQEEDRARTPPKFPSALCRHAVPIVLFTVCALYAGTLVAYRTTAPTHTAFRSHQLSVAVYIFVVATLSIATKCYASPYNVTPRHQNAISLSPIKDSNNRSNTSKVVLTSFNANSSPASDISVVARDKREFHSTVANSLNRQDSPPSSDNRHKGIRRTKVYDQNFETNYPANHSGSSTTPSEVVDSDANNNSNDTRVKDSLTTYVQFKQHFQEEQDRSREFSSTRRPMPPAHAPDNSLNDPSVLVLVVSVVVLTIALGLVTCVLNHYRGATAANPQDAGHTPTTAPMLSVVSAGAAAGVGGMDRLRSRGTRELAAARDRQVRMHSVRTDLAINLPPRISMPDGEEHPYHSRLHIRDPEQESEIYQKCIKPPPNRTVLESESPPPYRSSSVGLLGSISGSSSSSGDWSSSTAANAPLVVRCHSMSSSTGSSSKRVEASSPASSSANQKTDFLQRTVKRFTGGKKTSAAVAVTHQQQTATAHQMNVPVVIVPIRRNDLTTNNNSPSSSTSSSSSSSSSSATTTTATNFPSNRPKPNV